LTSSTCAAVILIIFLLSADKTLLNICNYLQL
jgi:hypothetical protein